MLNHQIFLPHHSASDLTEHDEASASSLFVPKTATILGTFLCKRAILGEHNISRCIDSNIFKLTNLDRFDGPHKLPSLLSEKLSHLSKVSCQCCPLQHHPQYSIPKQALQRKSKMANNFAARLSLTTALSLLTPSWYFSAGLTAETYLECFRKSLWHTRVQNDGDRYKLSSFTIHNIICAIYIFYFL